MAKWKRRMEYAMRFPVHAACKKNDVKKLRALLKTEYATNINTKDSRRGMTPFWHAVLRGYVEIAEIIIAECEKKEVDIVNECCFGDYLFLHLVCGKYNLEMVKLFVKKGADVHVKYEDRTLLHSACFTKYLELVKYLVSLGIDIHALDQDGHTAFDIACIYNYPEIVEYLAQFKL